MSDPNDNPQAAGIYRAMALRFYSRYAEARDHAEGHGGDLFGYGSRPTQRDDAVLLTLFREWRAGMRDIEGPPAGGRD